MKERLFKLNLQLHSDGLFDGFKGDVGENPLLSDDLPESSTSEGTDEVKESIDTNNKTPVKETTEPVTTSKPEVKEQPSVDFDSMVSKLDMILNKVDKPVEVKEEVQEKVKELTEEDIEKMNNDFYNKFTEKPLEALQELIEERANEKIKPVMEYFDNIKKMEYWNKRIDDFEKAHPDFKEYVTDVAKVIESDENIRNSKNPIELAYKVVKADKLEAKMIPLDEQIKDKDTLKKLLDNPELKNLIVQELKLDKKDIPKVIGSEGKTSVSVGDKPKSLSEATKAWLNS